MISAKQITLALRGRWLGRYGSACCPAHRDTHPSLSLADGEDSRLLAFCHAGCSFKDILDALCRLGLVAGANHYRPPSPDDWKRVRHEQKEWESKREANALACWDETVLISGTTAEVYLRRRGLRSAGDPAVSS